MGRNIGSYQRESVGSDPVEGCCRRGVCIGQDRNRKRESLVVPRTQHWRESLVQASWRRALEYLRWGWGSAIFYAWLRRSPPAPPQNRPRGSLLDRVRNSPEIGCNFLFWYFFILFDDILSWFYRLEISNRISDVGKISAKFIIK
jgi:hypothetical protein